MKKTSRILALLLSLVAVFSLFGCGSKDSGDSNDGSDSSDDGTVYTISWAHSSSTNDRLALATEKMAAELEEASNGRLKIEHYPASQLGAEREILEGVALGTIDCGIISSGVVAGFSNSVYVTNMPYLIDDREIGWKVYDGEFKKVFEEEFESYKAKFDELGITYFYTLIDDAVGRVMRSEGGFMWACKNYDGDVMSDMVSTAFGSLAMMTSVLVSPDGTTEFEAAHGTVTRHYYKHLKGEETSTNPMATIFAWSGAFKKRGELDGQQELVKFGEALEAASLQTLNDGIMTKDLCGLAEGITPTAVDSEGFIKAIRTRLEAKLA